MNSTLRDWLGGMAIVAIGLVGYSILFNPVGPSPTATPSPPATATSTPAAQLLPSGTTAGSGRYIITVPGSSVDIEFTLEGDWNTGGSWVGHDNVSMSFWTVGNVYADACDPASLPDPAIGPTVDDFIAAMDAQAGTRMTQDPRPIVIDGYEGKLIHIAPGGGHGCASRSGKYFADQLNQPGLGIDGGHDEMWVVDVEGQRIVMDGWLGLGNSQNVHSLWKVIGSMKLEP